MGKCLLLRRALCIIIRRTYIIMWPEYLVPLNPVWQHHSWGDSEHRSSADSKDRAEWAAQAETICRNWPAGASQHGTVHKLQWLSAWQIILHSTQSALSPVRYSNDYEMFPACLHACMSSEFTHYSCAPKCFFNHGKTEAVFIQWFVKIFFVKIIFCT